MPRKRIYDEEGREINQNGNPVIRRKKRNRVKAPSQQEWEELARDTYNVLREQVNHRCPKTNLPLASPAVLSAALKHAGQVEALKDETPDASANKHLTDMLAEKRRRRPVFKAIEEMNDVPSDKVAPLAGRFQTRLSED